MAAAARGSLTHGLELGANGPKRHFRICHGDARDHHHQAILGRSARGPFQQVGVRQPLSHGSSNGSPQALGGPSSPAGLIQDPHHVLPGVLGPHAPDRRQPSVHRRNDIAGEDAVSRLRRLGDRGRIPRPETGIAGKLSSRLRRLDAGLRALGNQRAFKLCDRAEDLEGKHALVSLLLSDFNLKRLAKSFAFHFAWTFHIQ